jgi:hypothetical protein
MTDYSTLSSEALRQYVATSEIGMPAYVKSNDELNRRNNASGHWISVVQMICEIVLHFWKKLWPF